MNGHSGLLFQELCASHVPVTAKQTTKKWFSPTSHRFYCFTVFYRASAPSFSAEILQLLQLLSLVGYPSNNPRTARNPPEFSDVFAALAALLPLICSWPLSQPLASAAPSAPPFRCCHLDCLWLQCDVLYDLLLGLHLAFDVAI